jgi:glycosyltransferase involved in cell wall biosynthesis
MDETDSLAQDNILLVSAARPAHSLGGRALLSKVIRDALVGLVGDRAHVVVLPTPRHKIFADVLDIARSYIDGVCKDTLAQLFAIIESERITKVCIDGSNLGRVACAIRRRHPRVEICTFFHNCEARFFWGALRHTKNLRALGVLLANYLAERLAVRFSDKRVCLSERDSSHLRRIYGRGATHILPMAMQDRLPSTAPDASVQDSDYILFVGGAFYANRAGITWFAKNVSPKLRVVTYVLGTGFDAYRDELERCGNVKVIGQVDDVAPWYSRACFLIAPIFDGSGMKTKVAEALMFGKRIIGTAEAFSGYESVMAEAGCVCETTEDFVLAIERELTASRQSVDPRLRALYEEHFSIAAATRRLAQILALRDASVTG